MISSSSMNARFFRLRPAPSSRALTRRRGSVGLPVVATASSLIAAITFIAASEVGKSTMLQRLEGQLEGQRAVPGELKNKPN